MPGKTIRIYLVSGRPSGIRVAEVLNWSGKVVVAPRSELAEQLKRKEARKTGVYCLVGPDPEAPAKEKVYVGEADNMANRIANHARDDSKDFWSQTIVISSSDDNLTKTHARYLEARLIDEAKAARRATIANATTPEGGAIPEPDRDAMEEFLEYTRLVLGVLGFSFLQPVVTETGLPANVQAGGTDEVVLSPIFRLDQGKFHATAREVDGELIVFKGAIARRHGVDSWAAYRSLREQLEADGRLEPTDDPDTLRFTVDVPFKSPSAAAVSVLARNAPGPLAWKVEGTGQTYKDWAEARLRAASPDRDTE